MSAKLLDRRRRFLEKIEVRDGHWIWTGTTHSRDGQPWYLEYGVGRGGSMQHPYREAYLLFRNRVVKGLRRQCDERLCVKPEHWSRGRKKGTCNPFWDSPGHRRARETADA